MIEYEAILAKLEEERRRIDAEISDLKRILARRSGKTASEPGVELARDMADTVRASVGPGTARDELLGILRSDGGWMNLQTISRDTRQNRWGDQAGATADDQERADRNPPRGRQEPVPDPAAAAGAGTAGRDMSRRERWHLRPGPEPCPAARTATTYGVGQGPDDMAARGKRAAIGPCL